VNDPLPLVEVVLAKRDRFTPVIVVLILEPVAIMPKNVKSLESHVSSHLYGSDHHCATREKLKPVIVVSDLRHRLHSMNVIRLAVATNNLSAFMHTQHVGRWRTELSVLQNDRVVRQDPIVSTSLQLPDRFVDGKHGPLRRDHLVIERFERSPRTTNNSRLPFELVPQFLDPSKLSASVPKHSLLHIDLQSYSNCSNQINARLLMPLPMRLS